MEPIAKPTIRSFEVVRQSSRFDALKTEARAALPCDVTRYTASCRGNARAVR